jgi:putative ABC transport system substrate-binding protein
LGVTFEIVQMNRRVFLWMAALSAIAPSIVRAQQAGKVIRIGWLGNSPLDAPETLAPWDAFRAELRNRGWSEGRNLVFVTRFAAGVSERHPQHVRELIDANVDLIVATSGPAARAAKRATDTIPVVFASIPDPVEQGLVASLGRPGGNLTGLTTLGVDLAGKRMQLLKEAFPAATRIGVLTDPAANLDRLVDYAGRLGVQLLRTGVTRAEDLAGAMRSLSGADAWFVGDQALYYANRRTIIDLVAEQRKPAMYPSTFFVDAGGLMAYSVAQKGQYRRLAELVDRILRGANPADLPVEQPTEFEIAFNLKTARALGLKVSPALLARADRVIE